MAHVLVVTVFYSRPANQTEPDREKQAFAVSPSARRTGAFG
jgi:hypothetical protein